MPPANENTQHRTASRLLKMATGTLNFLAVGQERVGGRMGQVDRSGCIIVVFSVYQSSSPEAVIANGDAKPELQQKNYTF